MKGLLKVCAEKASSNSIAVSCLNIAAKIKALFFYVMTEIIVPAIFLIEKVYLLVPFCIFSVCRQNQPSSTCFPSP
jgi:hypothetical protein